MNNGRYVTGPSTANCCASLASMAGLREEIDRTLREAALQTSVGTRGALEGGPVAASPEESLEWCLMTLGAVQRSLLLIAEKLDEIDPR